MENTNGSEGQLDYKLDDVFVPGLDTESMNTAKERFIEAMKAEGITPKQAQGLWRRHTDAAIETYNQEIERQANLAKQQEQRQNDHLNEVSDAVNNMDGAMPSREEIKNLAFQQRRELINHKGVRDEDYNRRLYRIQHFERYAAGLEANPYSWQTKYEAERHERLKDLTGDPMLGQSRSSAYGVRSNENDGSDASGWGGSGGAGENKHSSSEVAHSD